MKEITSEHCNTIVEVLNRIVEITNANFKELDRRLQAVEAKQFTREELEVTLMGIRRLPYAKTKSFNNSVDSARNKVLGELTKILEEEQE